MSDRYAVSLVPIALVLAGCDQPAVTAFLTRTAVWLCDRYEAEELGLASADSTTDEELARVFGAAFDGVGLSRRPFSQIAGVLLDMSAVLALSDLYRDIRSDVFAVRLYPEVLLTRAPDEYTRSGLNNRWDHNVDYGDNLDPGVAAAPHLTHTAADATVLTLDDAWMLLAASSALRDRHFPSSLLRLGPGYESDVE